MSIDVTHSSKTPALLRMNLCVLFLLQLVQAEVHFGALTLPEGHLVSVDEFVHVQLDYSDFINLPDELYTLQKRTTYVQKNLPESTDNSTSLVVTQFRDKITSILSVLNDTAKYFQVPPKHNRRKRGLINILGQISKNLFGTATEEDVDKLNDKVDQLASFMNDNLKVVQSTVEYNNKQTTLINQMVDQFNLLDQHLTTMKSEVYDLLHLAMYLDNLFIKSSLLQNTIKQHINDLTFTMNHILSPNLITPFELTHLLTDIETKFHFNLHFVFDQIPLFYQIIEPLLIQESIVLRIPVSSKAPVPIFFIHPFPSLYNDLAFTLNESDTFVAYSNQSLSYAKLEPQTLSQCKHLDLYYFCSAEWIIWEHASLTHNCLLDLITNTTESLNECYYIVHHLSSSAMYTDGDRNQRYLVTPYQEVAIVNCEEHTTHSSYRVMLNRTNVIPTHCSIVSQNIQVVGTSIKKITFKRTRTTVSSLEFTHLTLPKTLTAKLSKLALENTPSFSPHYFYQPTFLASSSIGILSLVAIVVTCFIIRKRLNSSSSILPTSTTTIMSPVNLALPELPSVSPKPAHIQHVALPSIGSF